jgi:hypothetical protein
MGTYASSITRPPLRQWCCECTEVSGLKHYDFISRNRPDYFFRFTFFINLRMPLWQNLLPLFIPIYLYF